MIKSRSLPTALESRTIGSRPQVMLHPNGVRRLRSLSDRCMKRLRERENYLGGSMHELLAESNPLVYIKLTFPHWYAPLVLANESQYNNALRSFCEGWCSFKILKTAM